MATHSSVLAWRVPGTGEPGGLPSMGSLRVGHDWSDLAAAAAAAAEYESEHLENFLLFNRHIHFLSWWITGQKKRPRKWDGMQFFAQVSAMNTELLVWSCCQLVVSQKDTLKLEFPVPMYVILFGKRFFADVTKLRGAHTELGWALVHCGLPRWCSGKESASQCRGCRFDFLVRRSPGEGKSNPLQYSCLGNPMDRGTRWATVHGVTKSQTRLSMHTLVQWLLCWSEKRNFYPDTQSEDGPLKTEGENGAVLPQAKDAKDRWQSPEARTRQRRLLSQLLWRHWGLLTS